MINATARSVFHRARLLKNFLEHEVSVFAALRIFRLKLKLADLHLGRVRAEADYIEAVAGERCNVVVVQENNLACVGNDGVCVAGEEVLSIADADDERRAASRADHHVRLFGANDSDAVSADDFAQRIADGLGERVRLSFLFGTLVVMLADKMRQNFRVRAGVKRVTGFDEALLELIVVLDHAVVDDGDLAGLIEMRMGVFIAGRAVSRPASVADADVAGCGVRLNFTRDAFINLALLLADDQGGVIQNRHARAVVAAIFEATQCFQQNGRGRFFPEVSDDAAHDVVYFCSKIQLAAADKSSTTTARLISAKCLRSVS